MKNKQAAKSRRSLTKKLLAFLIPACIGLIFLAWIVVPMGMAVLWSLVNPDYPWSYPQMFPSNLSLYHWDHVFRYTDILGAIKNSLIVAAMTTIGCSVLALPTAYAIGRRKLIGGEAFKIAMLLPMAMPGMAMAIFLGRLFAQWGLSNSYTGVAMAHILCTMPLMLRILTVSFESVPQDIVDAASNLGASPWARFKEVYVPMIIPGLIAGCIFTFIGSMEEFNLSFIIGAPAIQTVPTILYSYLGYNFLRTNASVVTLVMMVPNIIVLMVTERFIKTEYLGAALGKM